MKVEQIARTVQVLFCLLAATAFFFVVCFASEPPGSTVRTKAGELRVIPIDEADDATKVTLNDVIIFRSQQHMFGSIEKLYVFAGREVALIRMEDGGSGGFYQYIGVVLRPRAKPVVLQNSEFFSDDQTFQPKQIGEVLEIDLGFSEGFRKIARIKGNKLTVVKERSQSAIPVSKHSCDWLHSEVLHGCSSSEWDCKDKLDSFLSGVHLRGVNQLAKNPTFDRDEFFKLCTDVCSTKKIPSRREFGRRFCGAK